MCSEVPDVSVLSDNMNMEELAPVLKSIIVTRTKEGATVEEIIGNVLTLKCLPIFLTYFLLIIIV